MHGCIAIDMHLCIIGGMNPSEAIAHLKRAGLTEVAIAAKVGSRQSTINRIGNGVLKEPSYRIGKALVDLAKRTRIPSPTQQGEAKDAA